MKCRFCGSQLTHEFIDLVNSPPSNSFLTKEQLNESEIYYPLKLFVCTKHSFGKQGLNVPTIKTEMKFKMEGRQGQPLSFYCLNLSKHNRLYG